MAYVLSTADLDSAFADMAPVFSYDGKNYQSGDTVKLCREATAPDERKNLDIIGGDEYTWSWDSRPGLENPTGVDNSILLTNTPTTYIARPSEAFGCLDSMRITILPYINPAPPAVVSPVIYCRNDAATALKATAMPGATLLFYTTASGGVPTTSVVPSTSTAGTVTYYVSQKNGICESARVPLKVIVNPSTNIDSVTFGNPTTCLGDEGWIRLKADSALNDYTVEYDFNGSPATPVVIKTDINGYLKITGLVEGTYSNIVLTNKFGCKSSPYYGPIKLMGPRLPKPKSTNNGPICVGDSVKLSVVLVDGITYTWKGPGGFNSTSNQPGFIAKETSGGIYTVVAHDAFGCFSDPDSTLLVIKPLPLDPKVKNIEVCTDDLIMMDIISDASTSYTWISQTDGYTASGVSLRRNNATLSMSGKYYLQSINIDACKRLDSFMVVVSPRIALQLPADTAICKGDSILLYAQTNTGTVSWSPIKGLSAPDNAYTNAAPDSTTTYTALVKSGTSCPDTSATVTINIIPTPSVRGYDTTVRMNIPYTITPFYGQDVVRWEWLPTDSLSCADCAQPEFNSNRMMSYIVKAYNKEGCYGTAAVNIKVFCDGANLTMPNAFTPNGDGNNDIFYVRGTGFSVKTFAIYNRLGEEVFRKENFLPNDPKYGWDGTFKGAAISDAAGFVYMIELVCYNSSNTPEILKGSVLMIK